MFIGIDLGTSGCRAIVIDSDENPVSQAQREFPSPGFSGRVDAWWPLVEDVLDQLFQSIDASQVKAIACDATSGSVLISDEQGDALTPALMYDDSRAVEQARQIADVAPANTAATGASCTLAKVMWFHQHYPYMKTGYITHQADWLTQQLTELRHVSDVNNCIKLGFDVETFTWPDWVRQCAHPFQAPQVVPAGRAVAKIKPALQTRWSLSDQCLLVSGTTDSTAAVYATSATEIGDAVTSLGSTLVVKIISNTPVFSAKHGIYSQPYGDHFLVGGGSNAGAAVLREFFDDQQIAALSEQIDVNRSPQLNYYPLLKTGERFPEYDPDKKPQLTPRPDDDCEFLHGLLESLARLEAQCYQRLEALGAGKAKRVVTVGGGAKNTKWTAIRQQHLPCPVVAASHQQAAYGSALLARRGYQHYISEGEG